MSPTPIVVAGATGALVLPLALAGFGFIAAAAAAAEQVICTSAGGDVHHDDNEVEPISLPGATLAGGDTVLPVGRGPMGALHPTGARDFGRPLGTPVVAAHSGTVTVSADIPPIPGRRNSGGFGSYGRYVVVTWKGPDGWASNLYAHMRTRAVSKGQSVAAGELLGYVGSTGNSSGPHLHFELFRHSTAEPMGNRAGIDPAPWLDGGRVVPVDQLPEDSPVTARECDDSGGDAVPVGDLTPLPGPYRDAPTPTAPRGTGRGAAQAVALLRSWAEQGRGGYSGLCLGLADDAYAASNRVGSAIEQWYRAVRAGVASPRSKEVPVGAQMFWWTPNAARHIATYVGGGYVVTNVTSEGGIVKLVPAVQLDAWGPYLGWAHPNYG